MDIKVTKLTDVDLLRKANSFTTGRDSKMSLRRAYASLHSPIRTQLFFIEMEDIPLFCASQFVRSKVGVEWWQRSKRTDRGGEDFREVCNGLSHDIYDIIDGVYGKGMGDEPFEYYEEDDTNLGFIADEIDNLPTKFDRYAPTSLCGLLSSEAIINLSVKRLCRKSSKETTQIWKAVLEKVREVDEDLFLFCVPKCVQCGYCPEKSCGFIKTPSYKIERENYLKLFDYFFCRLKTISYLCNDNRYCYYRVKIF